MFQGSCLCGAITYEFNSEPVQVSHCHCRMCQKQHGAAFATYARVRKDELVYSGALEHLTSYSSSAEAVRKFCANCGSSLEWNAGPALPQLTSIALASLDTPYQPTTIVEIHTESRACWLSNDSPGQATS